MELNYLIYIEEVEQILGLFLETDKKKKITYAFIFICRS
jgi:hypothetical protein